MKVVGVGIDTARYGHVASFVNEDLQAASSSFTIEESQQGYEAFRDKLEDLRKRYPEAEFRCRIDAAGVYSANLEQFLRSMPWRFRVSVGSPTVNGNYRRAIFPKNKSDKTDSWALARYSVAERPEDTPPVRPELIGLQEPYAGSRRAVGTSPVVSIGCTVCSAVSSLKSKQSSLRSRLAGCCCC